MTDAEHLAEVWDDRKIIATTHPNVSLLSEKGSSSHIAGIDPHNGLIPVTRELQDGSRIKELLDVGECAYLFLGPKALYVLVSNKIFAWGEDERL